MNTQDKYNKIMEVMSDKTLRFGCIVRIQSTWWVKKYANILEHYEAWYTRFFGKWAVMSINNANRRFKASWEIIEIIWHPLHIWDVLYYIDKNHW